MTSPLVRPLCCEGICSGTYKDPQWRVFRRGHGYTPSQARAIETSVLVVTSHVESRREAVGDEVRVYWQCVVCGHERLFGLEERLVS